MRQLRTLVPACLALAALSLPASAPAASPRQLMLREVNAVRAQHGVHALRGSRALNRSSARYAKRLMALGSLRHGSPIGSSSAFGRVGETLALHGGLEAQVTRTVSAWMRSPLHRVVILDPSFRYFGAGSRSGTFRGRQATLWVGRFGSR